MIISVSYEVWGRPPRKKNGRRRREELLDWYDAHQWQIAVKTAHRFAEKGFENVVIREVAITNEMRIEPQQGVGQ